jgi:uncharacterized protein (TIGR02594 family)
MTIGSKKTAVWAACGVVLVGATLFSAPAEARRAKKKIVQPQMQQLVQPAALADDRYSHLVSHLRPASTPVQPASTQRLSRNAPRAQAAATTGLSSFSSVGASGLVAQARRFIGATAGQLGVPASLWCADFMNLVLRKSGHQGTGSRMASSFASYGRRLSGPQVGAIAVMSRGKRGGHVGVVSGIDASGNPIIISGNHNKRVAEAVYPRGRVYAYVMPN